MTHSFPKSNRLRKRNDLRSVILKGRTFRGALLQIKILRRKEASLSTQIAVSVSKRVSKLATERNLLRRRILEAYRQNRKGLLPGVKLWIQARGQKTLPLYSAIESELCKLLTQAGVYG